jgi:hypothetical protein
MQSGVSALVRAGFGSFFAAAALGPEARRFRNIRFVGVPHWDALKIRAQPLGLRRT